jgi:hypothetical protein
MADEQLDGSDDEIWSAILACEQILEAMPTDRRSLSTLTYAYAKIGDQVRAKEYMLRLADAVIEDEDAKMALELLPKMRAIAPDEEVKDRLVKLSALRPEDGGEVFEIMDDTLEADEPAPDKPAAPSPEASAARVVVNLTGELAFAWKLQEAEELTKDEYSSVVQDLTDLSSGGDATVTISVLHVLSDRGFKNLERVLTTAARDSGMANIVLTSFQLVDEAAELLPREFMVRRGAIPYEFLGDHVLVGILNPYDADLQRDVESQLGRTCHFYLVSPADFDAAIERIDRMDDEDEKKYG